MKYKIILIIFYFVFTVLQVNAGTPKEGMDFFNQFTNYSNSYNKALLGMYSPDVKIIREVVKPSGETEQIIIPSQRFFKELKLGQKTAKIKNYKNKYKNIIVKEIPNGLQVSAERQPSNETYWLKMYQILQNTDSGMKITEEMMQTKVQTFLKHKNKGG